MADSYAKYGIVLKFILVTDIRVMYNVKRLDNCIQLYLTVCGVKFT